MVGSAIGVKKLWKSLRNCVGASGRLMKERVRKKRGSVNERFDHYNFSDDDDDDDGKLGKKLRRWKVKAMRCKCLGGSSVIEAGKDNFVYVTDLYCSVPAAPLQAQIDCGERESESEKIKAGLNEGASGSNPSEEERRSERCEDMRSKGEGCEDSSIWKMKKKGVWWEEAEKGMREEEVEVDGHAEEFISKFYDEMRLQRQKSFVEYREMLERGTTS